jgi:hypothetical protein
MELSVRLFQPGDGDAKIPLGGDLAEVVGVHGIIVEEGRARFND